MTTTRTTGSRRSAGYGDIVPLPDPPRLADAAEQYKHMARADQTLETWLRLRPNTLVDGEGYLCFNRTDPMSTWVVPDCIIAFDVDLELYDEYNGYVISAMGKPPEFVMEVASRSTARRDQTTKRDQYAEFRVGEYWRFDPTGRYYDRPLAGERLVNGVWEPFDIHEDANGLLWGYSPALGLDLLWDDGKLYFRNPETGEILLSQQQAQEELEAAREQLALLRDTLGATQFRAVDAETRADTAAIRADDAETRADAAETRADVAEAEVERLRELLRRAQGGESVPE